MKPGLERYDEPAGCTTFHYKKCIICKAEIFIRGNSYPICDNCFAHRDDKPC
jgi:hypothetical protein